MSGFSSTVVINRPVDHVWKHLTDWERAPQWMRGIESCAAPDGLSPGKTLCFGARGAERQSIVRELVQHKKLKNPRQSRGIQ